MGVNYWLFNRNNRVAVDMGRSYWLREVETEASEVTEESLAKWKPPPDATWDEGACYWGLRRWIGDVGVKSFQVFTDAGDHCPPWEDSLRIMRREWELWEAEWDLSTSTCDIVWVATCCP
jgi:hypothetical protein